MKLQFKTSSIRKQWETYKGRPQILADIVDDFLAFAEREFEWEPVMTCYLRSSDEDLALKGSGVHVGGRAVDIRTRDVPDNEVSAAVEYINSRYQYDPERPSKPVAYAKPHGNMRHLHLQAHPNTILKAPFNGHRESD